MWTAEMVKFLLVYAMIVSLLLMVALISVVQR